MSWCCATVVQNMETRLSQVHLISHCLYQAHLRTPVSMEHIVWLLTPSPLHTWAGCEKLNDMQYLFALK